MSAKLNKITKISQENTILILKIAICQSSMVHKGCWVNCLTRVGNLEAPKVCWRESARRVQLSSNQAAVDRVRRVPVEDLVLSQEDKPKRHQSAREIWHETAILHSSVHRIIHRHLQLCSHAPNDVMFSSCLKPITSLVSLVDKQPYLLQ